MKNKLYILIDKNLDPIYGGVQGGHAVSTWLIEHGQDKWNNDYLIYLSVDINKWQNLLYEYDAKYFSQFNEPDLNNQTTSIAVWEGGLPEILKRKIQKEELLK